MKRYTHLTQEERIFIAHYKEKGTSIAKIALLLGRNKATISRELKRNSNQSSYQPKTAWHRYLARREKRCLIDKNSTLKNYILDRLYEGHSPEIISLRLRKFGDIENIEYISHESIYRWLYRPTQKRNKYHKLLIQHRDRRGRRKRVNRGKIQNRISIHQRPEHINMRSEVGHWEADLMSFRGNTQHLLVLHERKTRYTATIKLNSKTAQETITAMLDFFGALPSSLIKSVTFDNGLEFSKHIEITNKLSVPTYFCDVYASWQKGGIENMNGRLRRDLPRKTDLLNMDDVELQQIVITHNLTPRKVLEGFSPIETLAKHLNRNIIFLFNKGVALHL